MSAEWWKSFSDTAIYYGADTLETEPFADHYA